MEFLDENQREVCREVAEIFNAFQGEMAIAEVLDRQNTHLAFDVISGNWIFRDALDLNKTKIGIQEYPKWIVTGALIGGAYLVIKKIKWVPNIVKRFGEGNTIKLGAAVGAVLGAAWGKEHASKIFHFRVQSVQFRIEKEREVVDRKIQAILKSLFNLVAGGAVNVTCSISGELLQVPVSAPLLGRLMGAERHNCGSFEYSQIKREIEQEGRCPLCERAMRLTDLKIDANKRAQVSRVIELSIEWIAAKRRENYIPVDILQANFLRNPNEIIRKIKNQTLDGRELRFISKLVRERVEWYNRRVGFTGDLIQAHLFKNRKKLGNDQYFHFNRQLVEYIEAFEIELPELEQNIPLQEDPDGDIVRVDPVEEIPDQIGSPAIEEEV